MTACPAILISGFTAAGKTTHARLLAEDLGWAYLGLSGIRRELLGPGEAGEVRVWLASDERSRLRKAAVTFLRRGLPPPDGLTQEVRQKARAGRRPVT
jgi:predicted kinase